MGSGALIDDYHRDERRRKRLRRRIMIAEYWVRAARIELSRDDDAFERVMKLARSNLTIAELLLQEVIE